jgi:Fibronectin type III domain
VLSGVLAWASLAIADDSALTLRVDPGFSRSKLSATEQHWYDLTWSHVNGCASTVLTRSQYDDSYTYGRSIGDFDAYLLMGLRATGDRKFLDRVMVISDSMRAKLADADDACAGGTADGYLDWRWRAIGAGTCSCTNTCGGLYGSDHEQIDEAMAHGNIALVAYAFVVNADLDTAYASRATFWTNYLLHHWEAKWVSRAGGDSVKAWLDNATGMYKHEAHCVANLTRAAYYLYKITGNPFYLNRANDLAARSAGNLVMNPTVPTAYSWHHQVDNTTTWQAVNYATMTSAAFCDLHLDGFAPYASPVEMKKFTSTWRDIVFGASAPGFTMMGPDVYGGGTPIGISPTGMSAFARWDSTGKLMQYASVLAAANPSAVSIYTTLVAAGALMTVSARQSASGTPSRITNLAASQVYDQSLVLTWTAPSGSASGPATTYQLRRSSQAITDANFASATVVSISQAPAPAGSAEQFVVTGLARATSYHFAIRALDAAGNAAPVSNDVAATTAASDIVPPAAVRDLSSN